MSMTEGLWAQINPQAVGAKTALKRVLLALIVIFTTISVALYVAEYIGVSVVVIYVVYGVASALMPRKIMLWYQYRGAGIEVGFTIALWMLLGKSMAISATLLLLMGNALVTMLRRTNTGKKTRLRGRGPSSNPEDYSSPNTWFEYLAMRPEWQWLVGDRGESPLRGDFFYDETKEGLFGWKYLLWTLRHMRDEADFFNRHLFEGAPKKGWFERKSIFQLRREEWAARRAEEMRRMAKEDQRKTLVVTIKNLMTAMVAETNNEAWGQLNGTMLKLQKELEEL